MFLGIKDPSFLRVWNSPYKVQSESLKNSIWLPIIKMGSICYKTHFQYQCSLALLWILCNFDLYVLKYNFRCKIWKQDGYQLHFKTYHCFSFGHMLFSWGGQAVLLWRPYCGIMRKTNTSPDSTQLKVTTKV